MLHSANFSDAWYFSRRYQQFKKVADLCGSLVDKRRELSEGARAALRELNKERMACQNGIGALNLPSYAECDSCKGECCKEPTESYFSPIDYWLSRYSSHRVHDYELRSAEPFHHYLKARLKSLPQKVIPSARSRKGAMPDETATGCLHLGAEGCRLPHQERPVKCLIYACPRLKRGLDAATRSAYKEAINDLYLISLKTFEILKAEAGLPPRYGRASLFFTF